MNSITQKSLIVFLSCSFIFSCISNRGQRFSRNHPDPEITCNNIISAARPWFGTPYRYGGNSFDGVDCSAFVQNIYDQVFNIPLPRTTREMFEKGVFVRGDSFFCGDLLFFKNVRGRGVVDHVGIFVGNNKFIHASTTQGVVITDLTNNYYFEHFVSARRYN